MKTFIATSIVMSSLFLTSCVKTETKKTKINFPDIKTYEPVVSKKSGFKCDISGESENKEIFLQITKKDDKTLVSFYNFVNAKKISFVLARFEGYRLVNFTLSESTEDEKVLSGEGVLLHSDVASLSNEGKVIAVTAKLSLNEDYSGVLEQKLLISKDDNSIESTEFKEVAKIENCEAFDAERI